MKRKELTDRKPFFPREALSLADWRRMIDDYKEDQRKWRYSSSALNNLMSSFTPLAVSLFAPEEIQKEFLQSSVGQTMRDVLVDILPRIDVIKSDYYLQNLPTLGMNLHYCFPETPVSINYQGVVNSILNDSRTSTNIYLVLNRFLVETLDPEQKDTLRKDNPGWSEKWHSKKSDIQNRELILGDAVVTASMKLLGIQTNELQKVVDENWHKFDELFANTLHETNTNFNRKNIGLVLFCLAVLAAKDVEKTPSGMKFTFAEKETQQEQHVPPTRRFGNGSR